MKSIRNQKNLTIQTRVEKRHFFFVVVVVVVVLVVVLVLVRCSLFVGDLKYKNNNVFSSVNSLSLSQPPRRRIDRFHKGCVIYCTKLDKHLRMLGRGVANPASSHFNLFEALKSYLSSCNMW